MKQAGENSNSLKMVFRNRPENEKIVRTTAAVFASVLDPTLEEISDFKTAVSEAVTNCIVHAYPDQIGMITLKARLLPGNILDLVIRDRGRGIENVDQARAPMYTTGGAERSGMGFTIMESFMHELKVTSQPGKGTTVHMKRKIVKRGERP